MKFLYHVFRIIFLQITVHMNTHQFFFGCYFQYFLWKPLFFNQNLLENVHALSCNGELLRKFLLRGFWNFIRWLFMNARVSFALFAFLRPFVSFSLHCISFKIDVRLHYSKQLLMYGNATS